MTVKQDSKSKNILVPEKLDPARAAIEVSEWANWMEQTVTVQKTVAHTSVDVRHAIQRVIARYDDLTIQEGAMEEIRRQLKVYRLPDGKEMNSDEIAALELTDLAQRAAASGVLTEDNRNTLIAQVIATGVVVRMQEVTVGIPSMYFEMRNNGVPFALFDLRDLKQVEVQVKQKHKSIIEDLLKEAETYLKSGSIYKGTAINGDIDEPNSPELYYDPFSTIRSEDVVLSTENLDNIRGLILNPMEFPTKELAKRSFLWAGDYGTGKSITTALVAQFAIQHGYTVIRAKANGNLDKTFEVARRFEPSLVLIEDAEVLSSTTRSEVSDLLEQFDGLTSKARRVYTILTTNDHTQITKGMTRPGRIDGMFFFESLDEAGVKELYSVFHGNPASRDLLNYQFEASTEDTLDLDAIYADTKEFTPAFHGEVAKRAQSFCLGRKGKPATADYVRAARSLKRQFAIFMESSAEVRDDHLEKLFTEVVKDGVAQYYA